MDNPLDKRWLCVAVTETCACVVPSVYFCFFLVFVPSVVLRRGILRFRPEVNDHHLTGLFLCCFAIHYCPNFLDLFVSSVVA